MCARAAGRERQVSGARGPPLTPALCPQDLKEKKEVVEEAENGRDAPANGNAVSAPGVGRAGRGARGGRAGPS